ncbi:hypothetical protein HW555_010429 [Spodoptera exigua]|uniref:Uncharacterized protein n=1 Tax=Spodoptera exigua TaxID=7107 RepID=A0A835G7C0_SPOEX|nr:hypothetical protein HW555_010429 [Spodoptera exigua]
MVQAELEILERSDPLYLANAANVMGDYFAGARLSNGEKVHFLAEPLLQYMRALLASQDIRAHRSLATQLMQNGRELLSVLPQEMDELTVSIRIRLLSPPPVSTTWLLLSADLCLNQFHPLPNNMQQFYAAHLELTSEESVSEGRNGCWRKSLEENVENIGQNSSQPRPELSAAAQLPGKNQTQRVRQNTFDSSTARIMLKKRLDLNSWRQPKGEAREDVSIQNDVATTSTRSVTSEVTRNQMSSKPHMNLMSVRSCLRRRYDLNSWRQQQEEIQR